MVRRKFDSIFVSPVFLLTCNGISRAMQKNQRSSRNSPFAHGLLLYEAPKQHQVQYGNYDPDRVEQVFRKGGVAEFAHDLFR